MPYLLVLRLGIGRLASFRTPRHSLAVNV